MPSLPTRACLKQCGITFTTMNSVVVRMKKKIQMKATMPNGYESSPYTNIRIPIVYGISVSAFELYAHGGKQNRQNNIRL